MTPSVGTVAKLGVRRPPRRPRTAPRLRPRFPPASKPKPRIHPRSEYERGNTRPPSHPQSRDGPGVDGPPILDWFHLAMRLQHLTRIAGSLSSDNPERAAAKAVIVEEAERLRWRLWNGKAKDAGISIDRICAATHHFRDEPGGRRS